MPTFTATQTHTGQYRRYGDTFDEWDVMTDASEPEATAWCLDNLAKNRGLPSKTVWLSDYRNNENHDHDYYSRYFSGYYTISAIPGGYHFTRVRPYCD